MPAHVHIPTCIKHPPEEKTTKKKTNKSGLKVTSSAPHPNQRGRKKEEEKKKTKRKQKKKKNEQKREGKKGQQSFLLIPVKGGGLPDKVDNKAVGALSGYTCVALQLNGHLVAVVWQGLRQLLPLVQTHHTWATQILSINSY